MQNDYLDGVVHFSFSGSLEQRLIQLSYLIF